MAHAPSTAQAQRDGISLVAEVRVVEDPVVVWVVGEGLLDAVNCSWNVVFGNRRNLNGHGDCVSLTRQEDEDETEDETEESTCRS